MSEKGRNPEKPKRFVLTHDFQFLFSDILRPGFSAYGLGKITHCICKSGRYSRVEGHTVEA